MKVLRPLLLISALLIAGCSDTTQPTLDVEPVSLFLLQVNGSPLPFDTDKEAPVGHHLVMSGSLTILEGERFRLELEYQPIGTLWWEGNVEALHDGLELAATDRGQAGNFDGGFTAEVEGEGYRIRIRDIPVLGWDFTYFFGPILRDPPDATS